MKYKSVLAVIILTICQASFSQATYGATPDVSVSNFSTAYLQPIYQSQKTCLTEIVNINLNASIALNGSEDLYVANGQTKYVSKALRDQTVKNSDLTGIIPEATAKGMSYPFTAYCKIQNYEQVGVQSITLGQSNRPIVIANACVSPFDAGYNSGLLALHIRGSFLATNPSNQSNLYVNIDCYTPISRISKVQTIKPLMAEIFGSLAGVK